MKNFETNWTKDEMRVYLLIYSANADFVELKDEVKFIKSSTLNSTYNKMHKEFDNDSDFDSIQKLRNTLERFNYGEDKIGELFKEMVELFQEDGDFSEQEDIFMKGIKRVLMG